MLNFLNTLTFKYISQTGFPLYILPKIISQKYVYNDEKYLELEGKRKTNPEIYRAWKEFFISTRLFFFVCVCGRYFPVYISLYMKFLKLD